MEIEGTTFGTITIDGKTYEHDVIIRLSGEVVKRKKKLSKKYYGTSSHRNGIGLVQHAYGRAPVPRYSLYNGSAPPVCLGCPADARSPESVSKFR